jgi:hypothetical protein
VRYVKWRYRARKKDSNRVRLCSSTEKSVMNFASFWKEIAVVLAAFFAICSALSDVRDKRTSKITMWGRWFFVLTILSMIGGVYAQWLDNEDQQKRDENVQANMLRLLQTNESNVRNLSRILQPIDVQEVTIALSINCKITRFVPFCEAVKKQAQAHPTCPPNLNCSVDRVDWSLWPGDLHAVVLLYFFKKPGKQDDYINEGCVPCAETSDMYFAFVTDASAPSKTMTIFYSQSDQRVSMWLQSEGKSINQYIHTDKILSTLDLPGSMLAMNCSPLFDDLNVDDAVIKTTRGKLILVFPKILKKGRDCVFLYQFDAQPLPQHSERGNAIHE